MYMTGGTEEAPDWILDMARNIVFKQRVVRRKKNKEEKKIRPSRGIQIEIDYAVEKDGEEVVGDFELDCDDVEVHIENAETSEISPWVQGDDQAGTSDQVGGKVAAEPCVQLEEFVQKEAKPTLGELMVAQNTGHASGMTSISVTIPYPVDSSSQEELLTNANTSSGPQITISLPQGSGYEQGFSDHDELPDRKPLLSELQAAMHLSSSIGFNNVSQDLQDEGTNKLTEFQHTNFQQTETNSKSGQIQWPLASVKQEPIDDDYSHALSDQKYQSTVQYRPAEVEPQAPVVPFISNSTFGTGVVELEKEESIMPDTHDPTTSTLPPIPSDLVKSEPKESEFDIYNNLSFTLSVPSDEVDKLQVSNATEEYVNHQHSFQGNNLAHAVEVHVKEEETEPGQEFSLPFISNSTFGTGVVQLEDDSNRLQNSDALNYSKKSQLSVSLKKEPYENSVDVGLGLPTITCIVPSIIADLQNERDDSNTLSLGQSVQNTTVIPSSQSDADIMRLKHADRNIANEKLTPIQSLETTSNLSMEKDTTHHSAPCVSVLTNNENVTKSIRESIEIKAQHDLLDFGKGVETAQPKSLTSSSVQFSDNNSDNEDNAAFEDLDEQDEGKEESVVEQTVTYSESSPTALASQVAKNTLSQFKDATASTVLMADATLEANISNADKAPKKIDPKSSDTDMNEFESELTNNDEKSKPQIVNVQSLSLLAAKKKQLHSSMQLIASLALEAKNKKNSSQSESSSALENKTLTGNLVHEKDSLPVDMQEAAHENSDDNDVQPASSFTSNSDVKKRSD